MQKPDLFISVINILPILENEKDLEEILAKKLNIQLERYAPQAYACLEWFIPTAIGAYICRPYFEAFLQEMGKDHYFKFKTWFTKHISIAKSLEIRTVASNKSRHKLSKEQSQSQAISLESDTRTGHRLKFLFDKRLSEEVWKNCMYEAFDIIEEHFADGENDILSKEIRNKKLHAYIFGVINPETLKWEFVNDSG